MLSGIITDSKNTVLKPNNSSPIRGKSTNITEFMLKEKEIAEKKGFVLDAKVVTKYKSYPIYVIRKINLSTKYYRGPYNKPLLLGISPEDDIKQSKMKYVSSDEIVLVKEKE